MSLRRGGGSLHFPAVSSRFPQISCPPNLKKESCDERNQNIHFALMVFFSTSRATVLFFRFYEEVISLLLGEEEEAMARLQGKTVVIVRFRVGSSSGGG